MAETQAARVLTYAVTAALRMHLATTLAATIDNQAEYAGALRTMQATARGLRDAGIVADAATFVSDVLADVKGMMQ